ncbi:DnaJ C-terminal domain-containing protein [Desulfobulbus oligotrophicus]|jgi:curved DNA-binding protein|uniref:DnaJ domain-containing protein n=1 Tax=Desulfobulbus oligotrophicus TaxID=1909699 RepID=A0A7T5VCU0_9BACT|nr:DnaJ C-terminal domain-containing protein [Desulfobulbus oligotrophicus]MDY0389725.1 DnaJ C-terminal domain-containing protein [Desulfobulbus oligotrophicus]QQG65550.1 DnaJ domain-containing protein [Desulfobulbus oligotrophicus]
MEYKDYYKILDVSRDATQDQIKQAYRKVARKYHPDVSKETNAETKFKEIGEAYEVLKDPEKRAAYDKFGTNWQHGQDFETPPNWDAGFEFSGTGYSAGDAGDFSDFFEALFGHARTESRQDRNVRMRGSDQHAKIVIPIADAYHGSRQTITLSRPVVDTTGRVTTRPHILHVTIPKGIVAGQRIRLEGQGSPGYGENMGGDLYLEISFQEDRLFHAEKRDIHLTLPISPWEAALGAKVTVPTLGGNVQLKIPPGSQAGKKLRLKGRGLCTASLLGDQIVTLQIVVPEAQNEEQRALYRTMAEKMAFNPRAGLES